VLKVLQVASQPCAGQRGVWTLVLNLTGPAPPESVLDERGKIVCNLGQVVAIPRATTGKGIDDGPSRFRVAVRIIF
jgi:hypothetical protein